MNNRKVICHAHYHQGVSSSNEYAPVCNTKMIDIDLNEFCTHFQQNITKNFEIQNITKNLEIQIEYIAEIDLVMIQHVPLYPIHPVAELNSRK